MRRLCFAAALMLASGKGWAQLPACYAGFEISRECLSRRGLDQKAAAYQRKIEEAMPKLGASYKVSLRLVNHPVEAGYDATAGDVFTEVVRNEEMRNEAFIINVTTDFLEKQPEILFEASSLHEICHVMNDDLTGYHRNGANIEAAEEHCVLQATGEARYEEYLQAYARYQHWDSSTYERTLQKVKDVVLVGAPRERDEADAAAAEYFRRHADGREHLVIYNGELHEVSELQRVIRAGRPMILLSQPSRGRGDKRAFSEGRGFWSGGAVFLPGVSRGSETHGGVPGDANRQRPRQRVLRTERRSARWRAASGGRVSRSGGAEG